jgi:peptidyl-prolyl cis-trans isomerase SurA
MTLIGLLLLCPALALAQEGFEDKVVAVVGDEVILDSELEASFNFYCAQIDVPPDKQGELRSELLNQMINDKLLLIEARKDTSIAVTDEEVEASVDEYIEGLRQSMGSEEFEAQLFTEGLTLEELKDRFRGKIRDQLYVQLLVDRRIRPKINVTPDEVRSFYNSRRDSIPETPTLVRVSHILRTVKTSEKRWEETRGRAENIYAALEGGGSFESLALRYSDDRLTADIGGELGFVGKDELPDDVATPVFALEPGDYTEPLRGDFGYHIFKCEEKRENASRLKHILVSVRPTKEDSAQARQFVEDLMEQISGGTSFSTLATEYTDDPNSRAFGGDLGWMPIDELPSRMRTAVDSMSKGEIQGPILTEFGYHIFKLDDRSNSSIPTLDEIREDLKQLLYQEKLQQELDELLTRLRGETYIEIKS